MSNENYNRRERARRFGLDCDDAMVWEGAEWTPGGEYVKRLKVTNVTTGTLHFTYRVPRTKVFFMAFPEKSVLSAGNHVYIEVRFRPIARVAIEDALEIVTDVGSFYIPVNAKLPALSIIVTPEVVFNTVPVKEATTHTVTMTNNGQVDTDYSWQVDAPFSITPATGFITAGKTITFTVTILPQSAAVISASAVVSFQGGSDNALVQLRAISKYQYIQVDRSSINFGSVLFARRPTDSRVVKEEQIVVSNKGPVRASVSVEALDRTLIHQVSIHPEEFLLQSGEERKVTIRYAPHASGTSCVEYFKLVTPGGNSVDLVTSARTDGPVLSVAKKERVGAPPSKRPNSVQFGDIQVGKSMSHVVLITNHSNMPARYEFLSDPLGMFTISEACGTVPALLSKQVVFTFAPLVAGNFYKRITCVVQDSKPCFIDVMGTSYDDSKRPFPLRQKHVDAYRMRTDALKLAPLETVLQVVKERGHASDFAQEAQEAEWFLTNNRSKSGDSSRAANAIMRELFVPVESEVLPISVTSSFVHFGGTSRTRPADKQVVTVCNNSRTKMSIQWHVPPSPFGHTATEADGTYPGFRDTTIRDWAVTPETADLDPGQKFEFKVAFRPSTDDANYCQDLEIYAAPKLNRSFRLVDEESFTPPLCVPVRCMGHTFRHLESFVPKLSTSFGGSSSEQTLHLPTAALGEAVYYTFALMNDSDVAAAFDFSENAGQCVSFWPRCGCVPAKGFSLVTSRFSPDFPRVYAAAVNLTLNGILEQAIRLRVVASGSTPRLAIEEGNTVYVKPTGLGNFSSRRIHLRNTSRVPLRFVWRYSTHDPRFVVSPAAGDIEPNGRLDVTVRFSPCAVGNVEEMVTCDCFYVLGSDGNGTFEGLEQLSSNGFTDVAVKVEGSQDFPIASVVLALHSEAIAGAITFDEPFVDMGSIPVQSRHTRIFTIANTSDAALTFRLGAVVQEFTSQLWPSSGVDMVCPVSDQDYLLCKSAARQPGAFVKTLGVYDAVSLSGQPPIVEYEPADGLIAPRSRLRVSMHVTAPGASLYCVRSFAVLYANSADAPAAAKASKVAAIQAALQAEMLEDDPALIDWSRHAFNETNLWSEAFVSASYPTVTVEQAVKLASREALLALFPGHMSGWHNNFMPASLSVLGQALDNESPPTDAASFVKDLWVRARPGQVAPPALEAQKVDAGGWAFEYHGDNRSLLLKTAAATWGQMSIAQLNKFFSQSPSLAERNLGYFDEEAARPLEQVQIDFDPAEAGAPPAVVVLTIRNTSKVVVELSFSFEGVLRIDPEPWVDMPAPTGRQAEVQEVLRRRIFDIQPQQMRIEPGEASLVRLHYAHAPTDVYTERSIRALMRIKDGRGCILHLRGRTLPFSKPCIFLPIAARRVQLAPVLVGRFQAPTQVIQIANVSSCKLRYYLDEFTMGELAVTQHGRTIFDIANPDGVLEPGSDLHLRARFNPVEPKEYEVKIRICYHSLADEDFDYPDETFSEEFSLCGWGYARQSRATSSIALPLLGAEPTVMLGVPAPQGGKCHTSALTTMLSTVKWGASASAEALADALFHVAGLDALTAAVSTFHNPLDILTCLMDRGELKKVQHLIVALSNQNAESDPLVLFSGADAQAASIALSQLLHALDTLEAVREHPSDAMQPSTKPPVSVARALSLYPSSESGSLERGLLHLIQRLGRQPGSWSQITLPGRAPAAFHGMIPPLAAVTRIPHVDLPESMFSFSAEHVRLGLVPCTASTTAVVILRNTRTQSGSFNGTAQINDGVIQYSFVDSPDTGNSSAVSIHPKEGLLHPGEAVAIRIAFSAPSSPEVIANSLLCRISVDDIEYRCRCESTLTAILRQRDQIRRSKFKITPGSDVAHISVAEKTTFSRSVHLQEAKHDMALRDARRKLIAIATRDPSQGRRLVRESQAIYQTINDNFEETAKSFVSKQTMKPSKDTHKHVSIGEIVAAVLAGNMSIDESALLMEAADDEAKGSAAIQANMHVLDLPPPPSIIVPITLSATCVARDEFISLFSAQHLAAFVFPPSEQTLTTLLETNGEVPMLVPSSQLLDAFVKDMLSEMLADIAAEAGAPAASVSLAKAEVLIPADQKAAASMQTAVFSELAALRKNSNVSSLPPSVAVANAVQSLGSLERDQPATLAVQLGHLCLDNRLPTLRPTDFDLSTHTAVARVLRDSADCKGFTTRVIEGTLLSIIRDLLVDETVSMPSEKAEAHTVTHAGDAKLKALPDVDVDADIPLGADAIPDAYSMRMDRPEPEYKAGFDADD